MSRRSPWGSIRRLPSGRFQARYRVDDVEHRARSTFATKRDAEAFLAGVRTDLERGTWVDVDAGKITLAEYSARWLEERPLRPRTVELYEGLLRLHIRPTFAKTNLGDLKPPAVRTWHAALLKGPTPGASTTAKAYRLLRAILATAVDDEIIDRNPCRIRGAGVEHSAERPIATIDEVYALADAIEPRYRVMVLTATFASLRLGELRALTRRHVDLLHRTIKVEAQLQELKDGSISVALPKTAAGVRTVAIPGGLVPELEAHLGRWAAPGIDGWVFPGTKGQPFRRASFYTDWKRAAKTVGLDHLHFHDLRHTGATLAASTGATTKELMARLGHASPRAALIYQHATAERDRSVADGLESLIIAARNHGAQVHRLP